MKSIFLCLILGVVAVSGRWDDWGGPRGHYGHHGGWGSHGSRGGWDSGESRHHHGRKPSSGCPAPECKDSQDPCKLSAEENKRIVLDFYTQVFLRQNYSAVDIYYAKNLTQHNPYIGDGSKPFYDFISTSTPVPAEIFRPVADCDIVYLHVKTEEEKKPTAVVDIFRLACGKIVEHWDVVQTIPTEAANSHPMFET